MSNSFFIVGDEEDDNHGLLIVSIQSVRVKKVDGVRTITINEDLPSVYTVNETASIPGTTRGEYETVDRWVRDISRGGV